MMKSLLLVAVALVLVYSESLIYHETHPVTIQPNQGASFQILKNVLPVGATLNSNVTIYVDGELTDDVVVCLNKFYGLPPLGNYNAQTCDIYLVFNGVPKPSTTHETTSTHETATSSVTSESQSVESSSGSTSEHPTSESTSEASTSSESTSHETTDHTSSTSQESSSTTEHTSSTSESTSHETTSTTEQTTTHETTSTTHETTSTTEQTTTHDTTSTTHETTSTTHETTSTTEQTTTHDTTSTQQTTTHDTTSTTQQTTSTQQTTTHDTTSTTLDSTTASTTSTGPAPAFFRRYITLSQMAYEFLTSDIYNVGVYFLNTPAKGAKLSFTLGFNGTYCAAKTTGTNCENAIAELGDATHVVLNTQLAYYTFNLKPNTDVKQAVSNLTLSFASASYVNIYASSYYVPSADKHDFYGNSTVTIPVPTPGTWYVAVSAGVDGDNVTVSNKTQTANIPTTSLNAKEEKYDSGKIKAGTTKYYSINLNSSDSLSVTIKTEAAVTLYAGFNRVPQLVAGSWENTYDVTGCNLFNCSAYKNIKSLRLTPNPANGTWFVAVVSGTTEEKEYTIWYQYDCPANCSQNGVCQTDKSNFGVCKCNGNFEGLTCSQDNMIIEYIILIIIAALVLVSALLGLIAWAYMRRRSQYVEVK